MNIEGINQYLRRSGIRVTGQYEHSKASEAYVDVLITAEDRSIVWEGTIPYEYRRTGISLGTEAEVADYLRCIKQYFNRESIRTWVSRERKYWSKNFTGADITGPFFNKLLTMRWISPDDFPQNRNPQRRIQDIKDKGYTIASKPEGRGLKRLLLPLPRTDALNYEVIPAKLRTRIMEVLGYRNTYEAGISNRVGLLPDHKFPEIRWDENTPIDNRSDMSKEDIRAKFQLIDNRRNQQKREVCRLCFQTGQRGVLYGIHFFYEGSDKWDKDIPKSGSDAECGCVGCGWYDIQAWRDALNKIVHPEE